MSGSRSGPTVLLLFLLALPPLPWQGRGQPELSGLLQALDRGEEGAAAKLQALGEAAVLPLCRGFGDRPPGARLRRAELLARLAGAAHSDRLGALLAGEEESRVKLVLIHTLGRRDVTGWRDHIETRVQALATALDAPERLVREAAFARLAAMDEEEAARLLADLVRRRASPFRERAVRALAEMESAWRLIPDLLPLVGRELPRHLDLLLGAAGRRYSPASLAWVVTCLGVGDRSLRQAAWRSLLSLDAWFFQRRDHRRRLAILDRARQAWPWNLDLALKAALVAVLDFREGGDPRGRCRELERLLPATRIRPRAGVITAEVQALRGVDHFLAGRKDRAEASFRRAWNTLQGVRARHPEIPEEDTRLLLESWFAWRSSLDRPLDEETRNLRERIWGVRGGPRYEGLRGLLREGGRIALLAAVAAANAGDEEGARQWLLPVREALDELEERWDADYLGDFGEQDAILEGRPGVVDLLARGLGRNGRWREGERGFLFLLRELSRLCPDYYLPPPTGPGGDAGWRPGPKERAFSTLSLHLVDYLVEAGERERALRVGKELERTLRGRGLAANQEYRMRVLFRLAGIHSDMRRPDPAEKMLEEYLAHYQGRQAEIEQHPEFFRDPAAARRWVESMLARGHVSMAVLNHVLRGRDERASFHCRRAFELEGSDFNRVLYACYLARQGRRARAVELAESVDKAPELYYNLACTWALLGEKERALALLRRDLEENHLTPAARNNHREWAAGDPDLEGLYVEKEFKELIRREAVGER